MRQYNKLTPRKRYYSIGVFIMLSMVAAMLLLNSTSASSPFRGGSAVSPRISSTESGTYIRKKGIRKASLFDNLRASTSSGSLNGLFAESITTYAADCTTPKSAFTIGETVCAVTDGVDLGYPGGRWVHWLRQDLSIAHGGNTETLITTNPQSFSFVPDQLGSWKVTIAETGDISQTPATFTVSDPPGDGVAIYQSDCTTPATSFNLGETVCAKISNAPLGDRPQRQISFQNQTGYIAAEADVTTDPQTLTFTLPTTATSGFGLDTVDNRGQWTATSSSTIDGAAIVSELFFVRDPAVAVSDLAISKTIVGDGSVGAGGNITFSVILKNYGPDAAAGVELTDAVPGSTTFVSGSQTSGPSFTCVNPTAGGTGTSTCTRSTFNQGDVAEFIFVYKVDTGVPAGTEIANVISATSTNHDRFTGDNTSEAGFLVASAGGGGGSGTCTLGCPDDIEVVANTTDGGGNSGAIVHFSAPSGNDECGTIITNHCNDCFFPLGATTVTATSATGDSCSFVVQVNGTGTAISCPAGQTANADSSCQATISVGTPTATGDNVTIIGTRSDGFAMYTCDVNNTNCVRNSSDAPFSAGTTVITWIAYSHSAPGPYTSDDHEESLRTGSASCTQTIVVNDVNAPVITATDSTASAGASCTAAVPDYSNSASDNCACASSDESELCEGREDIVVTQDVAAGTQVGPGTHTINLTATDQGNNTSTKTVTFTVVDTTPATFTFVPPAVVAYTGAGATSCETVVSDATLGTPTATDNCGTVTITRSPTGNTFPVGTTTITWTATDGANNTVTATQTVTVVDNTPPVVTPPANIVVYLPLNSTATSMAVTYPNPATATDNCPGTITFTYSPASGSTFSVGTTTVTVTATDVNNNSSQATFTVTVLYNFTGFFSPVNNPPTINNVNAGRTIPLKFSLSGNKGLGIFAADYPVSQQIACDTSAPLSDVEGTETTGGSTLTYSPDQYHYNWKTESSWAGTCRVLIVKLNDGSEHIAYFKFK
jgi:uncharacterized repeat protein (TIGR01451 family)